MSLKYWNLCSYNPGIPFYFILPVYPWCWFDWEQCRCWLAGQAGSSFGIAFFCWCAENKRPSCCYDIFDFKSIGKICNAILWNTKCTVHWHEIFLRMDMEIWLYFFCQRFLICRQILMLMFGGEWLMLALWLLISTEKIMCLCYFLSLRTT